MYSKFVKRILPLGIVSLGMGIGFSAFANSIQINKSTLPETSIKKSNQTRVEKNHKTQTLAEETQTFSAKKANEEVLKIEAKKVQAAKEAQAEKIAAAERAQQIAKAAEEAKTEEQAKAAAAAQAAKENASAQAAEAAKDAQSANQSTPQASQPATNSTPSSNSLNLNATTGSVDINTLANYMASNVGGDAGSWATIIKRESRGQIDAYNPSGAYGVFQSLGHGLPVGATLGQEIADAARLYQVDGYSPWFDFEN